MCRSGLGEEALAEEIVRRTPLNERGRVDNVFLSPDTGFESELQRGYRIGSVFTRHHMPRARAAFNKHFGASRIDGWRLMHGFLRDRVDSNGFRYSGWCITMKKGPDGVYSATVGCQHALEAIPWAVADPDRDGDIIKVGDSPNLDILDGLRYGIASYEYPAPKPAGERLKERLIATPVVGPHRFTTGKAFEVEERQSLKPVYLGAMHNGHRQRKHWR
jgi:hypothetical protein